MLRHKAQIDQLTNIANRSHFSAESERVIAQQSVLASPVSFIIFDLDFFKHVNDNHGHLTGDWVLEHTVKAVKPLLRNSDLFGRMGGEDFANSFTRVRRLKTLKKPQRFYAGAY